MAGRTRRREEADRRPVVLVDGMGRELGTAPALDCHVPPGRLHRAFTTIVLDAEERVLLARRAAEKLLWPGHWDATVASHPGPGETNEAAAARRAEEELGVAGELVACPRFEYRAAFGDVGVEHEVCRTFVLRLAPGAEPAPDPAEISALRREDAPTLLATIAERADELCPWALLALLSAGTRDGALPEALRGQEELLRRALAGPFPSGGWRLLEDGA